MIFSEDFLERIGNAVYNYKAYENDNNIRHYYKGTLRTLS